jgi:hypothetical protein
MMLGIIRFDKPSWAVICRAASQMDNLSYAPQGVARMLVTLLFVLLKLGADGITPSAPSSPAWEEGEHARQ